MSDTAQLPVEEPLPFVPHNRASIAYHRWLGIQPYNGSARERAAFLAGFAARDSEISEEDL